jgi:aminodeoxyfutalosine synthase
MTDLPPSNTRTPLPADLAAKVTDGVPLSGAELERVWTCPDLIAVGMLGETARKQLRGERVTYVRVCVVGPDAADVSNCGEAGEVRLAGPVESVETLRQRVRQARAAADDVVCTGFSLTDLARLAVDDLAQLGELAAALRADGLAAVAELPLDEVGPAERAIGLIEAAAGGGLGVWRATVNRAPAADRLRLIELAEEVQRATGAFRAFAPLPRQDSADEPSTGYDDVRTVAVARLGCPSIPSIQVDWPLYGPKLAQVALTYGADDIDGVAPVDVLQLGHRRSPREDIERQIRAAFAEPAERDGRFVIRS